MLSEDRNAYLDYAAAQRHPGGMAEAAQAFFSPSAQINVVHPFNLCDGSEAYVERVVAPLHKAFTGLYRRDDIVMCGEFAQQSWVSATGYYAGHFGDDWIGLSAPGQLCFLRFGEFHRMEAGRAVESYLFLDIPELMVSIGCWPISVGPGLSRGYTGMIPGPASHDGVIRTDQDAAQGQRSLDMVTQMLASLATEDEAWRPYWHDNMMWYGPGAFGSFIGVDQFATFQVPFEGQFEGWSGGSSGNGITQHFTRYGEGHYVCSGGWPSVTGVNVQSFLGQPPSGERVVMRVCDWWRREGDVLVENWVFVDVPHVLLQLGCDVLPEQS